MKYRIGISGSYGGMNLGDEAILEGILKELRSTVDADVIVFSRHPEDTQKRHKVKAIPIQEMHKDQIFKELMKLDLFILGGGGILFDGMVENFLRDVIWAKELGIPVMIYAISVGPLKKADSKRLVIEVLNQADVITVRENGSKRILNDLGITKSIEVTGDPALLIDSKRFNRKMLEKEGINPKRTLVGFSVREPGPAAPDLNIDDYHRMLANAADFMSERFEAQILFIPMEHGDNRDQQHSHAVIAKMQNAMQATVLKKQYTPSQILGLMKQMSFAVGMRLHFLIFAFLQKVPFFPLPYASKVTGLLEELELPASPIKNWDTGKLCAVLDRTWDGRKSLQKKLAKKIPLLKEKAKKTNQILCEFLSSITPKK